MKFVVFDFDGTLTFKSYNLWKRIWLKLGYSVDENSRYREYFRMFSAGKISHQDWCDLTRDAFREKNFKVSDFKSITSDIKLIPGAHELFETLVRNGYHLFVVSGNIKDAIVTVLGEDKKYFDDIYANDFLFNDAGKLEKIVGTSYDFEGKLAFVNYLIKRFNLNTRDITFVGNGSNDEWVYQSGCRTICINPDDETDKNNEKKWNILKENVNDLTELIDVIEGGSYDNRPNQKG